MGDWLGNDTLRRGQWRPFEEARVFVRSLGLESSAQWFEYARSDKKPRDIPSSPHESYAKSGWISWGDWLGTGYVANQRREYRPFEEARAFVRSLGIRYTEEWREYVKSGKEPDDIPANPDEVYSNRWKRRQHSGGEHTNAIEAQGEWRGWADWLGVVSIWSRPTLLAFLEDLRPRLKDLEETELYLILQQGGALPGLKKALGSTTALGVLQDLQVNDGRELEAALEAAAEEEVLEDYADGAEALEVHTHEDALESGTLATPEALRLVDDLAGLHYGLDDETAQYLVDNRVAGLWEAYTDAGEAALGALSDGGDGHYLRLIRERFSTELEGAKSLPIPAGWAFRPPQT